MRKKLFAILMSAMMMVTFMPAMAFAAKPDNTWGENNTTYIYYDGDDASYTKTVETVEFDAYGYGLHSGDLRNALGTIESTHSPEVVAVNLERGKLTYNAAGTSTLQFYLDDNHSNSATVTLSEADGDFTVSYPTWKKYSYKKGTAVGGYDEYETGKVTVELKKTTALLKKAAELASYPGKKYDSSDIKLYSKFSDDVTFNDFTLEDEDLEWYVKGEKLTVAGLSGSFDYDGDAHAVVIKNPAINVTATYAIKTEPVAPVEPKFDATDAEKEAYKAALTEYNDALKAYNKAWTDEDFTETVPTVTDAGRYKIAVKFVLDGPQLDKDTKITDNAVVTRTITVNPKTVQLGFKQNTMVVEYGTVKTPADVLQVEGVLAADKALADAALAKVNVKGFFTEVGSGDLVLDLDVVNAINSDKAVFGNYAVKFNNKEVMNLVIEKADNEVTCPTTNKVVKASKVKKAAQKVTVKTTAKFGEVKLTKVSGSAKLKVNGNKIVVKKGTKKGTYKIKVRASVVGTANYAGAKITKTITIKVK